MFFWIISIGLAFLISVLFAGILIPQILLISFRKRLFDKPDERKIHQCIVPRLGGIVFKPVIFLSIFLLLGISLLLGRSDILTEIEENISTFAFAFCSVMILYLVGMADDLIGVRYSAKFFVQIICGIMLIAGGVWFDDFHGLLGFHHLSPWFAYPFTVLIVVFIINAINLIDGIDGLASGLSGVALLFYGLTFIVLQSYIYAMLSFAALGVLVPFFYYNVFGNPNRGRKIFMGDTGSLTIGIILCLLSLKLLMIAPVAEEGIPNPLFVAFSPLIIPCFDVVRVYFHRIRNGKNPFMPDKNHIHHKLLAIGLRQRVAMITIVLISILLTLCNILLSQYINVNILLLINVVIWTGANIWLTKKIGNGRVLSDKKGEGPK